MDPKLEEALGPYKDYFEPQEDGKLKCLVNGHCFPANRTDQIAAFVNGARFAKLKVRYDAETALVKYEPFIVISKNFPHMLYCALTGQLLEKSLAAVKKHMGGKRFVKAKARFVADQADLRPEPSLREFGIILPGEEGGRKSKKQRKADAGAGGDEDEEMREADGEDEEEDEEEEEEEEGDSDGEPAFWVPPGDGVRGAGGKGREAGKGAPPGGSDEEEEEGDEEDGEAELEEEDGGLGSGDMMETDEDDEVGGGAAQRPPHRGRQERAGPSGRAAVTANGDGARGNGKGPAGAAKQQPKGQQPPVKRAQGAQGHGTKQQQQQQQQERGQGAQQKKTQPQQGQQGAQGEGQQKPQAGREGTAKLSKKQRKKAAAAAAETQPDDFDFDLEANGGDDGGMPDAGAQPPQPERPTGQLPAAGVKPKKKNVNRPAPAKKARQQ